MIRLIELEDSCTVGSARPWAGILDYIIGRNELSRSIHRVLLQRACCFDSPCYDGLHAPWTVNPNKPLGCFCQVTLCQQQTSNPDCGAGRPSTFQAVIIITNLFRSLPKFFIKPSAPKERKVTAHWKGYPREPRRMQRETPWDWHPKPSNHLREKLLA